MAQDKRHNLAWRASHAHRHGRVRPMLRAARCPPYALVCVSWTSPCHCVALLLVMEDPPRAWIGGLARGRSMGRVALAGRSVHDEIVLMFPSPQTGGIGTASG